MALLKGLGALGPSPLADVPALGRGQRLGPYDPHAAVQRQFQDLTFVAVEGNAGPLSDDLAVGGAGPGLVETTHLPSTGNSQRRLTGRIGDRVPGEMAGPAGDGAGELDGQPLDGLEDRGRHFMALVDFIALVEPHLDGLGEDRDLHFGPRTEVEVTVLDGLGEDRDLHFGTGTVGDPFGCAPVKTRPDDDAYSMGFFTRSFSQSDELAGVAHLGDVGPVEGPFSSRKAIRSFAIAVGSPEAQMG